MKNDSWPPGAVIHINQLLEKIADLKRIYRNALARLRRRDRKIEKLEAQVAELERRKQDLRERLTEADLWNAHLAQELDEKDAETQRLQIFNRRLRAQRNESQALLQIPCR